ncbi:hypothetical protein [Pseudomonas sp. A-B-26]|uniref:hypothetical protein n=1 Tax=Pseudomonas sp. A-B-26 TaxID=2832406 RepID=UPI001CBE001C|nr:hypothetical protein [Pseudomonas sp. A-B-26]
MTSEHWQFNSNITWHYYSSAFYESVLSSESNNPFQRYHHLRACTYFSVCCVEAFLNAMMREKLTQDGFGEEAILKKLRKVNLEEKIRSWPSDICGKPLEVPGCIIDTFKSFQAIRNEVTHAKNRDHSIYADLDRMQPALIVDAVARLIVTTLSAKVRAFPYWLLGWNYVGFNGNPAHPFEGNNLNGFVHSLRNLGIHFNNYGSDIAWEQKAMTSTKGYDELKNILSQVPMDIEPRDIRFPQKPQLTRRWWDVDVAR